MHKTFKSLWVVSDRRKNKKYPDIILSETFAEVNIVNNDMVKIINTERYFDSKIYIDTGKPYCNNYYYSYKNKNMAIKKYDELLMS